MVTPYFENIDERIIEQINNAQTEILVAVAWLTNSKIGDAISKKSTSGIKVEIIVSGKNFDGKLDDNKNYLLQYLFLRGCMIYKIGDNKNYSPLMHHKFCIIDNKIVINGSFNWTNNAMKNDEDIIITDDPATVVKYSEQFKTLKLKLSPAQIWFANLQYSWQQKFKNEIGIEREPTEVDLEKIALLEELDLSDLPLFLKEENAVSQLNEFIECNPELTEREIEIFKNVFQNASKSIEDLSPLSFLKKLRILNCSATDIKTLEPIKGLIDLESLDVSHIENSNLDIEHLIKLKKLKVLSCGCTQLQNWNKIRELESLENLILTSMLIIPRENITSLEPLRNLRKLKYLDVSGTRVRDLSPISELKELEFFHGEQTLISALEPLYKSEKLKEVGISDLEGNVLDLADLECNNSMFYNNKNEYRKFQSENITQDW